MIEPDSDPGRRPRPWTRAWTWLTCPLIVYAIVTADRVAIVTSAASLAVLLTAMLWQIAEDYYLTPPWLRR